MKNGRKRMRNRGHRVFFRSGWGRRRACIARARSTRLTRARVVHVLHVKKKGLPPRGIDPLSDL